MYSIHNSTKDSLKVREQHFKDELNKKIPSLEYIDGYIHSDGKVNLRCKICGNCFQRSAIIIRHNNYLTYQCDYCNKIKRDKLENERKIKRQIDLYKKEATRKYKSELNKYIKELYKTIKNNTVNIHVCCICNEEYIEKTTSNKCALCRKKISKRHSYKSLKGLYKRDKGICHICNKKCDYEDYTYVNDTFIAGNNYPSIDHIIPLNKGGTDEWDNLKLAHRYCNTIKRDKMLTYNE